MRSFGTTTPLILTALLALLLIGYVFAGGGQESGRSNKARCSTAQVYDQIKRELFHRAAVAHPATAPALAQVAGYSLVRRNSQVRRRSGDSGTVKCAGSIALELPPGVAVVGGRRSLAANVSYSLAPGPDGSLQLVSMSKADAIVVPLGALVDARQAPRPIVPATGDETVAETPLPPPPPTRAAPEPSQAGTAAPPARRPDPVVRQSTAKPPPRPAPPKRSSEAASRPAKRGATADRPTAPPVVTRPATASPSFNCRYARTRGEIAVCRDPGLASLDRQMASQFNRAKSAASPGARVILERSRTRFLRYRDSCGSDACIADAYRGRMREINDIASRY